jgi:hypothetical protein
VLQWVDLSAHHRQSRCHNAAHERSHLVEAQLLGALAKHKQHGVNHIGLAAAVRANHGGEALHRARPLPKLSGPVTDASAGVRVRLGSGCMWWATIPLVALLTDSAGSRAVRAQVHLNIFPPLDPLSARRLQLIPTERGDESPSRARASGDLRGR